MPNLKAYLEAIVPLAGAAARSFALTFLGMGCLGVALAIPAYLIAANGAALRGLWAVLAALATALTLGGLLATKRAAASALLTGLRKLDLARQSVGLVFDRLLGVSDREPPGERGSAVAKTSRYGY